VPPLAGWKAGEKVSLPQVIDTDPAHPLTQWIDMGDVVILEATPLEVPPGGTTLIESDAGPIYAVAPRQGFEDAVLGLVIVGRVAEGEHQGETYFGTTWPVKHSFPVFVFNALQYLGKAQRALGDGGVRPGEPVTLDLDAPGRNVSVRTPSGEKIALKETQPGSFVVTTTEETGVYEVLAGSKVLHRFAVNLFSSAESDIRTRLDEPITINYVEVAGQSAGSRAVRRELWKILLLVGVAVLLVEWRIYHRRVHL
jgi:hypothetical protein